MNVKYYTNYALYNPNTKTIFSVKSKRGYLKNEKS